MDHVFNTIKPRCIDIIDPEHMVANSDIVEGIRTEKQLFNATPSFVQQMKLRSPIVSKLLRMFRKNLITDDDDYHSLVINSYCQKLAIDGMYPSIPGWHCDYSKQVEEEERTSLEEDENVRHWILVMGINNPPTCRFLDKFNIHINDIKLSEHSWRAVSAVIDKKVKDGWCTRSFKVNEIIEFRGNELYSYLPTTEFCWRIQIKITLYPKGHKYRPLGSQGKVRELQMVYMNCSGDW